MKKNVRNALAISGLALAIGASGLTLTASANTANRSGLNTERQQSITKITRIKKAEEIKNIKHRRTIPGFVSAISTDSLTITKGEKTYTVTTSLATRVLDRKWNTTAFSDIKIGDKVRVFGTVLTTDITAQTIRDISLPTPATK